MVTETSLSSFIITNPFRRQNFPQTIPYTTKAKGQLAYKGLIRPPVNNDFHIEYDFVNVRPICLEKTKGSGIQMNGNPVKRE